MIRSISRPMARIPAPCIKRLFAGGLPHASANTSATAVQYVTNNAVIPSKSVSPVAIFRYGKRQPDGCERLSSIILTTELSAITAWDLFSFAVEARRINPQKGDDFSRLSQSQIAEGIFFAERFAGNAVVTSGSNSVISPRGS